MKHGQKSTWASKWRSYNEQDCLLTKKMASPMIFALLKCMLCALLLGHDPGVWDDVKWLAGFHWMYWESIPAIAAALCCGWNASTGTCSHREQHTWSCAFAVRFALCVGSLLPATQATLLVLLWVHPESAVWVGMQESVTAHYNFYELHKTLNVSFTALQLCSRSVAGLLCVQNRSVPVQLIAWKE